MIKFFQYVFTVVLGFGLLLLVAGLAGAHGHFQFRPNMTEDWIMFGTPVIGFLGLIWVTVIRVRRKE